MTSISRRSVLQNVYMETNQNCSVENTCEKPHAIAIEQKTGAHSSATNVRMVLPEKNGH